MYAIGICGDHVLSEMDRIQRAGSEGFWAISPGVLMRIVSGRVPWRTTIAGIMAMISVAALMMMSSVTSDSFGNDLLILSLMFFLPFHLLIHLERGLSFVEVSTAALAMAYLIWGATIRFSPGEGPYDYWPILRAIHDEYWQIGYRLGWRSSPIPMISAESQRWNWGLLAVLYAAILIVALTRRTRARPVRTGDTPSHSTRAGSAASPWRRLLSLAKVALPIWFLCYWHHTPCPVHSWPSGIGPLGWAWCRWVCLMGFTGSLVLALLLNLMRFHRWCPRWYAARMSLLVPAVAAGIFAGVVWSLVGRGASIGVVVSVMILIALASRFFSRRRRWLSASSLLAMFWGFDLSSAEITVISLPMFWGFALSSAEITATPIPWAIFWTIHS